MVKLIWASPALVCACSFNPVHDEAITDLGPEEAGVPQGPLHRPDEPCLVCHAEMSVAGTIHAAPDAPAPLANVVVTLTDARGSQTTSTTNAAGNFFVDKSTWNPAFPVHASIALGNINAIMNTEIGRDGSCASCHVAPATRISAGLVFLAPAAALLPDGGT